MIGITLNSSSNYWVRLELSLHNRISSWIVAITWALRYLLELVLTLRSIFENNLVCFLALSLRTQTSLLILFFAQHSFTHTMPTIFRLQKSDLQDLIRLLLPDIAEEKLSLFDEEKIKVLLSEWLMLNNCSSLHNFQKDSDGKWIKPNENECECCVRFKIGKKITS